MTNIAKLTAGALLLVTGFAWATSQTLRTEKKMEKVKPVVGFSAKVQRATSQVPQLLVDGSEDGVPYGLQLQSVNDRKVKLSWLSPVIPTLRSTHLVASAGRMSMAITA